MVAVRVCSCVCVCAMQLAFWRGGGTCCTGMPAVYSHSLSGTGIALDLWSPMKLAAGAVLVGVGVAVTAEVRVSPAAASVADAAATVAATLGAATIVVDGVALAASTHAAVS